MHRESDEDGQLSRQIAETRFTRLHNDHGRDILAYALRRAEQPEDAADIVAETFLVAWRRAGDIPPGDEARLWLYGVARRVLANHQRGERRRLRLAAQLRTELRGTEIATNPGSDTDAGVVLQALDRITEEDRELLTLVAWEELEPAEVARVLGISKVAARSRLHRARRRLRAELSAKPEPRPGHGNELECEEAR